MKNVLKDIEYKGIFHYFEEISEIPRGSRNNKGISDYLVKFAKDHQLEYVQDEYLNVVMIKEATKGYEECPSIIIQGHMDMVCEKNSDVEHDFLHDGLDLRVKDDFVYANGTTLGGDNGIAIAYALAILASDEVKHPRLEVIITTDEEIGMDGAIGLDTSNLRGQYMLNIDSEEEGILLSSSAGGLTGTATIPLQYEEVSGKEVSISIKGLYGGHSGMEINKNRTNGTVLMGRLLFELGKNVSFSVTDLKGGSKDNAIPREAFISLVVSESEEEKIKATLDSLIKDYQHELSTSEPGLNIEYTVGNTTSVKALTKETFDKVLYMIIFAPNGVQAMSSDIEGLVESSLNLGIFKLEDGKAIYGYAVRSSLDSYKRFLSGKLEAMVTDLGGSYATTGVYPAWEYKKDSKLREISVDVFKQEYGREPEIQAIHAGLECGIIAGKMPGIDIISLGPDMFDVHTPGERLSISSTKRVFDYVLKVLEAFQGIK